MSFTNQIGKYQLVYYGKRSSDASEIARIYLYDDTDQYFGAVLFYRDGQTIPNNSTYESNNLKKAFLRIHERQLDSVIDMLRNEKPCSVYYASPTYAYLYTGKEPVGEEESEE